MLKDIEFINDLQGHQCGFGSLGLKEHIKTGDYDCRRPGIKILTTALFQIW